MPGNVVRGLVRKGKGQFVPVAHFAKQRAREADDGPSAFVERLVSVRRQARIVLGDQVYTLRKTRAGKLILTK